MVHTDSSVLPLLREESIATPREYLCVFIDDCLWSAAIVLDEALLMMQFEIETIYSDNGKELKKTFRELCVRNGICQSFTKPYRLQANGKAE